MKLSRLTLAAVGATSILLLTAACGGGSDDVPSGSIAVVDGTEISQSELDTLLARAKKGYASQKQDFPKVGTEEYQTLRTQYVAYLVQREQFEQHSAHDRVQPHARLEGDVADPLDRRARGDQLVLGPPIKSCMRW